MKVALIGAGSTVFAKTLIGDLLSVEEFAGPVLVGVRRAPSDTVCADLIEMAVGPAHGRLDGQVQPIEPDVERHLDTA